MGKKADEKKPNLHFHSLKKIFTYQIHSTIVDTS